MFLKRRRQKSQQRGDTLVEVLFATATAALIIVITLVIMNRNLAQIQMNSEVTFVRQAIDSQAEVLRYMRDKYMENRGAELSGDGKPTVSKTWKDLVDVARNKNAQTTSTEFGTCQPNSAGITPPATNKAFFISNNATAEAEGDAVDIKTLKADNAENILNQTLGSSETYARPGQGIWIESVNPAFASGQSNRYVDFHIRACWDPPFEGPRATLGTIVRLYYETPGGAGVELGEVLLPICSNGTDDDGDGKIDFPTDIGCTSPADVDETDPPPIVPDPDPCVQDDVEGGVTGDPDQPCTTD
jgi:type II secretory pathway pseudopilin PulG